VRSIPPGTYRFVDHLDDDGVNMDSPVKIAVAVTVEGDELTVDLEGTSPQVRGAINSTLSFAKSAVYFAVRSVMDSDAPNNAGFFRPIHVKAPLGCLVNPRPPAAVAARGISGFRLIDAMFGALAQAIPERVRAAGEGGTTSYSFGCYDADGRFSLFREAIMGAWGGGCRREGIDGIANGAANISNAPIEMVENQAPIRVERYELVPDSGGAGEWRGGMSVLRQLRFLGERATLQLRSDRRRHSPYGLMGGRDGEVSNNLLDDGGKWQQLPTKFTRPLAKGQAVRHTTAAAGGYGDPRRRDPELVLADVIDGKVTPEGAERDYGVVVRRAPWRVDMESTTNIRKK
jgi:N-methylhydantoinase B